MLCSSSEGFWREGLLAAILLSEGADILAVVVDGRSEGSRSGLSKIAVVLTRKMLKWRFAQLAARVCKPWKILVGLFAAACLEGQAVLAGRMWRLVKWGRN